MILLVDNYDSFTFNLVQALAGRGAQLEVVRNDAEPAAVLASRRPEAVLLSPGPGRPEDSGCCLALLDALPPGVPVLGVCLGHQALVLHHGGELELDPEPVHGRASAIHHAGSRLLHGLPSPFAAGRYHSIRARRTSLPACLSVTAWTDDGLVMAVEHRELPHFGLQFHPESFLTPLGDDLLGGFLTFVESRRDASATV